jgi:prephenate dehydratase
MLNNKDNFSGKELTIHTLGPSGTNCEAAANSYLEKKGAKGKICLHETLEKAVIEIEHNENSMLLGCVVYPELHTLVFSNLTKLKLVECFVFPTLNMVLASGNGKSGSVSSHPAPKNLIPEYINEIKMVNSNSQAAINCYKGITDACITTITAAKKYNLEILEDFGKIPMGFTIHAPILN